MSKVRVIIQASISDYENCSTACKAIREHVDTHDRDALAWESFADQDSGQLLIHELYANADAFVSHVGGLRENGLFDDLMAACSIEKVTSLTSESDPRVLEILEQMNAVRLHGLAGVVR